MNNPAGVFQIEEVLERKLKTSGIQDLVDVIALEKGIQIRRTKSPIHNKLVSVLLVLILRTDVLNCRIKYQSQLRSNLENFNKWGGEINK